MSNELVNFVESLQNRKPDEMQPDDLPAVPEPEPPELERLASWQLYSLADAYQERPPIRYLAGALFELPSLNVIYAPPGAYKSFLVADLACCVAGGKPWLPPLPGESATPVPTAQGTVMWVDFDNGQRRTHDRFAALGRAHQLPDDLPNLRYASMPKPWLDIADNAHIADLAALVTREAAVMLVVDNLGTVTQRADENSGDMVQVFANLRWLAEETGAAVVAIHHQRKSTGAKVRAGETMRGHSSIEAALDLALLVEREFGTPNVTVTATKTRGADVPMFGAAFTYEKRPETNRRNELATARFFGRTVFQPGSPGALRKIVFDTLGTATMTKTQLIDDVYQAVKNLGGTKAAARSEVEMLLVDGLLVEEPGQHNRKYITQAVTDDETA